MSQSDGERTPSVLPRIKIFSTVAGACAEWFLGVQGAGDFMQTAAGGILTAGTESVLASQLSDRERWKTETVARRAIERAGERCANGDVLREDSFLSKSPSSFEEAIEGALMTAQRTYESKKLLYIGNLVASFAFDSSIDQVTASWCIRMAESLSWTQLVLLALASEGDESNRADLSAGRDRSASDPTVWSVWEDWEDLYARRLVGMEHDDVHYRRETGQALTRRMIWTLVPSGRILSRLMELEDISAEDRDSVYAALARGSFQPR